MLVSLLIPSIDEKVEFVYAELYAVPEKSGCYILTAYDGTILYIGQSKNICKRMERHLDDNLKTKQTPWGVAFWLYYKLCDEHDLSSLENGWLNQYMDKNKKKLPFFNKNRKSA